LNEIVFPAAILQPPFFYPPSADAPLGHPALNFGGIGAVIAHEISHGYDDQGRQYDANGELNDWWTEKDAANYLDRASKIVEQFNGYEFFGKNVNGKLTQGENIADLGGASVSFAAMQEYMKEFGDQVPQHEKFTQDQLFFISFGQIWRNLIREEEAHQRVITDPHSPGEFRADGPLSNLPEFYKAFGVQAGDKMYRDESIRVSIW
jgi:putative endopeptidase